MDQSEVTKTIGQMRAAANSELRARRIAYRVAVALLTIACLVLGFFLFRTTSGWTASRTYFHNAGLDGDETNRFTEPAETYVTEQDASRLRVVGWGIFDVGTASPNRLLVVRYTYVVQVPSDAEVVSAARWSKVSPGTDARAMTWDSGDYSTLMGRGWSGTAHDELTFSTNGCHKTKNADGGSLRMCFGSTTFSISGLATDREAIPDDIVLARKKKDGSLTGLARTVLADEVRRWDWCDLLTCSEFPAASGW